MPRRGASGRIAAQSKALIRSDWNYPEMRRFIHITGSALGVKEGEGRLVWLLLLANFLVGVGRNFSATAGNALFLERFGADLQPYLYIATSLLVPALAAVYLAKERRLSFSCLFTLSLSLIHI
jgi:hypothetical protein